MCRQNTISRFFFQNFIMELLLGPSYISVHTSIHPSIQATGLWDHNYIIIIAACYGGGLTFHNLSIMFSFGPLFVIRNFQGPIFRICSRHVVFSNRKFNWDENLRSQIISMLFKASNNMDSYLISVNTTSRTTMFTHYVRLFAEV